MKKIFIYNCEIINSELLVIIGTNLKNLTKWAEKNSKNVVSILKNKECLETIKNCFNEFACVAVFERKGLEYYMLFMKEFNDKWNNLDVLNHEVRHYCQFQFDQRKIKNEKEFEAYFQENVYRELRLLLYKNIIK